MPVFGPERAGDETDFADIADHDAVTEIINDAIRAELQEDEEDLAAFAEKRHPRFGEERAP